MSEDYGVQLSLKRGNDMLNIRAKNAHDFSALYNEVSKLPELNEYFPTQEKPASEAPVVTAEDFLEQKEVVVAADEPTVNDPRALARARMKGGK